MRTHNPLPVENTQTFSTEYDNCYNEGRAGYNLISYERYANMSRALRSTGRDIVYAMCNWGEDGPWNWATVSASIEPRSENCFISDRQSHTPGESQVISLMYEFIFSSSPPFLADVSNIAIRSIR
jgi:hypothetical protein